MDLKNRIIFPPLVTNMVSDEGHVTDRQIDYYAERARGGAGLIVIEASYPRASGYPKRIMLRDDAVKPGLKRLVEAIHQGNAKAVCQVNTHRGSGDERDPASPSPIPNPITGIKARQLTVDDIKRFEEEFGEGVRRVKDAGFDGVMIHGATGYLVAEFLSPLVNKRTDAYGGDLFGRARFALELVEVTRKVVGPDYPVMFRLTADERVEGGFGIREAVRFCNLLEEAGVDEVDVTSGSWGAHEWTNPVMEMPPGCNVDLSEAIKKGVGIPVGVVGKINDPDLAEKILREGKADFICIGRGLVADPYLPQKAQGGRKDDICRCITCARCGELFWTKKPLGCSINPAVGYEKEFAIKGKPASRPKRVLVIGGGPAGMEAALIAARKGHEVTLWEKSDSLGGQLNIAKVPPGKGDLDLFLNYLKIQMEKSKVHVALEKAVNADEVLSFAPEAVVVATGANPLSPDIPGIEGEIVLNYLDVLTGKKETGGKVIVMGGGYLGCETSLFLSEKGKKVTLVFRSAAPAFDVIYPDNRVPLLRRLEKNKVTIEAGVKEYKAITSKGLRFVNKEGQEVFFEGDHIVLATGAKPNNDLGQSLKGSVSELYEVGDCVEARRILEAVYEGAMAALDI